MKKIFVIILMFAAVLNANAQENKKRWSVIPRLGLNLSNLDDMDLFYDFDKKQKPSRTADVMAGAEFEYRLHPALSVGVGALYSRQGCHYKSYSVTYSTDQPNTQHVEGVDNNNIRLQYINIPVTGSWHISESFALKLGVQCGVFLAGNWTNDITTMDVTKDEVQNATTMHADDDLEWMCAKTVWSMPLGVQFEYCNVLVDISYAIPLTGFAKEIVIPGATKPEKMSKGRNQVLSFSVGYRF